MKQKKQNLSIGSAPDMREKKNLTCKEALYWTVGKMKLNTSVVLNIWRAESPKNGYD